MPLKFGANNITAAYLGSVPITAIRLGNGPNLLLQAETLPTIGAVTIDDTTPTVGQTLTATATNVLQADTVVWTWTVTDRPVPSGALAINGTPLTVAGQFLVVS